MSFRIYPNLPSAPIDGSPIDQEAYHFNLVQSEQQELLKLEEKYEKKYEKYSRTLERLILINGAASGISIASGISGLTTLSTMIGIPISFGLGVVSITGASLAVLTIALVKKYQKKLTKVTRLVDIARSALAVFETSISEAIAEGKINGKEFKILQTGYFKALNELSDVDRKLSAETRAQFEKTLMEEINNIKTSLAKNNST